MNSFTTIPIYAVLLGAIYLFLSINVIKARRAAKVSLMDGDDPNLIKAIRTHGNFIEYVPFCLLLLIMAEANNGDKFPLHVLGAILLISRLLHPLALHLSSIKTRVIAMSCTFTATFGSMVLLLNTLF